MNIVRNIKQINRDIKTITRPIRDVIAKFILDKKRRADKKLDFSKVKTVLFLRDDNKIGDMVISTGLFREIKKKYPKVKVIVLAGKDSKEIIKYNPYVDEIIETSNNLFINFFILQKLRIYKIDVLVDFYRFNPRPYHMFKLRQINPCYLIGFCKDNYNMYDISLNNANFDTQHITNVYKLVLEYLGVENISLQYDIFLSDLEKEYSKKIKGMFAQFKIIFLNACSASIKRNIKLPQLNNLINLICEKYKDVRIILNISDEMKKYMINKEYLYIPEKKDILSIVALVNVSDVVITPDTSIVHIGAAYNKKMIALYLDYSRDEEKINIVWGPNYKNAFQISVDSRDGKIDNDIKNIDNEFIIKQLSKIIEMDK